VRYMSQGTKTFVHYAALAALIIAALAIRMPHFKCLIPYFYYGDELRTTRVTLDMFQDRTLNPRFSIYPGISFYLNGMVYASYFFYETAGQCLEGTTLQPVLDKADSRGERSRDLLLISRGLSLTFGILSIIAVYLLGREFIDRWWGLSAATFYALIPVHITLSHIAKVDIFLQFFITMSWWYQLRLIRTGLFRHYGGAALFAALALGAKMNYWPFISLIFAMLFRAVVENQRGFSSIFLNTRLLGATLVLSSTVFLCSPYWFWDLDKSLKAICWVYFISSFESWSHIDPHHWWLDKYFYSYLFIMPFILGLPLYLAGVSGAVENIIRVRWKPGVILFASFIAFGYVYTSQCEGTYAYYIDLFTAPLLVVFATSFLKFLWEKRTRALRLASGFLIILVLGVELLRINSYYQFSIANFDRLGPWVSENIPPDDRGILFSVYSPGEALGMKKLERIWPQDLSPELIQEKSPDYIFIDTWDFGGFKKFYKDISPVERYLDELLSGKWGYRIIKRFRARYFMDTVHKRLDPEHNVEMIVMKRENRVPGHGGSR
jgi:hypothetical protein